MTVEIKARAMKKMKQYIKAVKVGEVGGLLLGKIKDGNMIVKDAIILKQTKSAGGFLLDETSLMDMVKNESAKKLASIVGWWHSHCNFGCFWSSTDDSCFERLSELCGKCIGLVISKPEDKSWWYFDMKCRMDVKLLDGQLLSMDDVEYEIEKNPLVVVKSKKIKKEVEEKVTDAPFVSNNKYFQNNMYSNAPRRDNICGFPIYNDEEFNDFYRGCQRSG